MIKLLFYTLILISITGCTNNQSFIKEPINDLLIKRIPDNLLVKSEIPKPPSKESFISADYNTRMILLKDYLKELMFTLKESNNRIEKIKEINDKM